MSDLNINSFQLSAQLPDVQRSISFNYDSTQHAEQRQAGPNIGPTFTSWLYNE